MSLALSPIKKGDIHILLMNMMAIFKVVVNKIE